MKKSGFTEEEIDVLLPLLVHEGYLKKQVLDNGKTYYKRTNKPIPTETCPECLCHGFQHYGFCSRAMIS